MKLRTSLVISLQNIINRNNGFELKGSKIKSLMIDHVAPFLEANEDLALAGKVSKDSIDFLTRQIKAIEANVEGEIELREPYAQLLTIFGIGKILGLTIMLETGPISRFDKVGNYVSYCRKVSSKWISNDKGKGKGNKKNGNISCLGIFRGGGTGTTFSSGGPCVLQSQDEENELHDSARSACS